MSRNRSGSLIEDLVKEMNEISTGKDEFDLRFIRPKQVKIEPPESPKRPLSLWEVAEDPSGDEPIVAAYKRLSRRGEFPPGDKDLKVADMARQVLREAEDAVRPHINEVLAPIRELFGDREPPEVQMPLDFRPGGLSRDTDPFSGLAENTEPMEDAEIVDAVVASIEQPKGKPGKRVFKELQPDGTWKERIEKVDDFFPCDNEVCSNHPVPGRFHSWVKSRAPGEYGQQYCTWCGRLRR